MRALLVRLTLIVALVAGAQTARADDVPPAEAYARAVAVMAGLAQSPYAAFTTSVTTSGFGVRTDEASGFATLAVGFGSAFKTQATWQIALRSADGAAVVRNSDGSSIATHSSLFKPTWQGAYQWTRYGFGHPAPPAAVVANAGTGAPTPDAPPSDGPEAVIGRVQSISPNAYQIDDAPALTCPDGSSGRHLHLTARSTPETHPLTDVVIDDRGGRICTMRFNLVRGNALSLSGVFDLDFGDRGGYWVVIDGNANVVFRVFGVGAKHASMKFAYSDFVFGTQPPDPKLAS